MAPQKSLREGKMAMRVHVAGNTERIATFGYNRRIANWKKRRVGVVSLP
jgi:hypothetical protein